MGIQAAFGGLVFAAALAAAPRAAAQDPNGTGGALTVLGNDTRARACANFSASGVSSDEAVEACTRALAYPRLTREGAIELHSNRGIIYLRRHQGQDALADFDATITLDPRSAEAHLNRGAALVMLQQPGPAVAEITQALSLGVREPEKAYFNRGAAREALGDLHGAYEDYTTALEIRPDWGPANEELARFVRGRREHLATILNEQSNTP